MEGSLSSESKATDITHKKCNTPFLTILKKKRKRKENSLGELTRNFIDFIIKNGEDKIDLNYVSEQLNVKKRRIYDITNVLEGIGYIKKLQKNQIQFLKRDLLKPKIKVNELIPTSPNTINNGKTNPHINLEQSNKSELERLREENIFLERYISQVKREINQMTNYPENKNYSYITFEDLKQISNKDKASIVAIQAPPGTTVDIPSKEIIEKMFDDVKSGNDENKDELLETLKMKYQLFMETENSEINVFLIPNKDENVPKQTEQLPHTHSKNNNSSPTTSESYLKSALGSNLYFDCFFSKQK